MASHRIRSGTGGRTARLMDPHLLPHHSRYSVPWSAGHGIQRCRAGLRPRNFAHRRTRTLSHLHRFPHLGGVHGSSRRRNRRLRTSGRHHFRAQVGNGRADRTVLASVFLHRRYRTHGRRSHIFFGPRGSVSGHHGGGRCPWRMAALLPRLPQRGVASFCTFFLLYHYSHYHEHHWSVTAGHRPGR